ncbi:MAG TPA: hypothetical protein VKT31_09500 [Solirubrobacteraceae bacterium]|nr:hypothetical protein [Solirubrobacteraceae bacterium]
MKRSALIAGVASALVLAACGSSGPTTTGSASGDPALAFSQCMRAHGVTNFPDPSSRGGGFQIGGPGSNINPRSPAFQAAQTACAKFSPKLGPRQMTAAQFQAALRFAECMRAHGQPEFPDPARTVPHGAHLVLALRGMVFAPGPGVDPRSPAFRQAASACGLTLPGKGP